MSIEAPAYGSVVIPAREKPVSLPPLGTYLSAVKALGIASFRPSLPALAFAYFYLLGTGLYLAFSAETDGSLASHPMIEALMRMIATFPLFLLVDAPVLPVQDTILRGARLSFWGSVQVVLSRAMPLIVATVAQVILLAGPPMLLLGGVGLMVRSIPSIPGGASELASYVRAAWFLALIPCAVYFVIMALLLTFTQPAVILDSRGPLSSIRTSFSMVASRFGGVFGRLLVFNVVLMVALLVASLPIAFLQAMTLISGYVHPAIKVANAIWEAAITAASFPFSVASVLILYRSILRAGSAPPADGAPAGIQPDEVQRRATSPFQFE
jgi:hypothetical protein